MQGEPALCGPWFGWRAGAGRGALEELRRRVARPARLARPGRLGRPAPGRKVSVKDMAAGNAPPQCTQFRGETGFGKKIKTGSDRDRW